MTTRQESTITTIPAGFAVAMFGAFAAIVIGIGAMLTFSGSSSSDSPSTKGGSALAPSNGTQLSPSELQQVEMQIHESLTTNEFGPVVVPAKTLEEQIAEAIADHENGLAAQLGR